MEKTEVLKREEFITDLRRKWEADPSNANLGIDLGKELIASGSKDEGVDVLIQCRNHPEAGWKALEALYSHCRNEGDFPRALSHLRELMPRRRPARDSKEWKEITYRMGDLYIQIGDPSHAGHAFFDIFKSDPGFRDVKSKLELVEVMESLLAPVKNAPRISWFMGIGGKVEGPVDLPGVKECIDAGKLSPDDLVWSAGFSGWKRAREADKIGLLFKFRERLQTVKPSVQ